MFRTGLADFLTHRTSSDLRRARILKDAAAASSLRELKSGAEYAGQHGKTDQPFVVIVDVLPKTRSGVGILPHHTAKID